jgi:phosphoheptose isomerase
MNMQDRVRDHFSESIATKEAAAEVLVERIADAGNLMSQALLGDG